MSYYVASSLVEELFNMVLVLPKWVTRLHLKPWLPLQSVDKGLVLQMIHRFHNWFSNHGEGRF